MAGQAGAQACQGMRVESEFQVLVFSFTLLKVSLAVSAVLHTLGLADHKVLGRSPASVSFLT